MPSRIAVTSATSTGTCVYAATLAGGRGAAVDLGLATRVHDELARVARDHGERAERRQHLEPEMIGPARQHGVPRADVLLAALVGDLREAAHRRDRGAPRGERVAASCAADGVVAGRRGRSFAGWHAVASTHAATTTREPRAALRLRRTRARSGAERPQLALQAIDLLRLLGLAERLLVDADRVAGLAGLLVRVAEVLGDGRIVAGVLDRALELLDRRR